MPGESGFGIVRIINLLEKLPSEEDVPIEPLLLTPGVPEEHIVLANATIDIEQLGPALTNGVPIEYSLLPIVKLIWGDQHSAKVPRVDCAIGITTKRDDGVHITSEDFTARTLVIDPWNHPNVARTFVVKGTSLNPHISEQVSSSS